MTAHEHKYDLRGQEVAHTRANLHLEEGDSIKVLVRSIPSSGYVWLLGSLPFGVSLWSITRLQTEDDARDIYGGFADQEYHFLVTGTPEVSDFIGLHLVRPWIPGEIERSHTLRVAE